MNEKPGWIPSELYVEILKRLPICCADVVLFNTDKTKVLLCKRTNKPLRGEFFTPGGRLLKGESLEEGVVREAKEELGIELSPTNLVFGGVISEMPPNSAFGEDISYHAVTTYFGSIVPENISVTLDNQNSEYKWFDVNDPTIHPNIQTRVKNTLPKL